MPEVVVSGPLFDGRARVALVEFMRQLEFTVAWQVHAEAMTVMNASFKNPTPYYEVQVTAQRRGTDMVVHDRGIAYGPWLESGRSYRPTRFKGYHSFRRAAQAVVPKVVQIAYQVLPPFLRRMGG